MGGDELATITKLNQFRAVFREHIEANQGRVVDMAGDSVLAIFETAAGAVLAGVAVQNDLAEKNEELSADRRMLFRVGVHLGDIHEQDDGTIYGDGVNVAARLESLAEPGGICVSDMARGAVKGQLDLRFSDLGVQTVKNIAEPVRAYGVLREGEAEPRPRGTLRSPKALTAMIVAVAGVVGIAVLQFNATPVPSELTEATGDSIFAVPQGPTIAVLPFDNMSGDPEQDYFVDGLTEEIIVALSRFSHLTVISRSATFRYKGHTTDARTIGGELGAGYVVQGSIRRSSDKIRVTARLIDVDTEADRWSETFERALTADNVFALQDDITAKIAATIGDPMGVIAIADEINSKRARSGSLDSYECVLRASEYARSFDETLRAKAQTCLEKTVTNDPNDALAWAWLAELYLHAYKRGVDPPPGLIERAQEASNNAVRLAPDDSRAFLAQANAHYYAGSYDRFAISAERAIKLNPYSPDVLFRLGHRFAYAGQWQRGLALVDRASELHPYADGLSNFVRYFYHYDKGEYDLALAAALAIDLPDYLWTHAALAAAYGQLGRTVEAERAVARMLRLRPNIAKTARADRWKFFRYQEDLLDRFMEGLRKAGLQVQDG
jgi:TolB-like protein/Tfp pilus assembly protein PilF